MQPHHTQTLMTFLQRVFQPEHMGPDRCLSFFRIRLVCLRLSDCSRMPSFAPYFGQSSALRELSLKGEYSGAPAITHVPNNIGQLSRLEILAFDGFVSVQELPDTLGQLSQLTHLTLDDMRSLRALPESLGQLSELRHLVVKECRNLQSLPDLFGQLSNLEHLELSELDLIERLPESLGELMNLSYLKIFRLALRTIPDPVGLRSLRILTLGGLLYLSELPLWLEGIDVTCLSVSEVALKNSAGRFTVTEVGQNDIYWRRWRRRPLAHWIHRRAMEKVKAADYGGAVRELCANLGALGPDLQAFLLQERGIAKRLAGDLRGAQEDLVAAVEVWSDSNVGKSDLYHAVKHLGFVKFLLGDLEGAQCDGETALELEAGDSRFSPCLGEEPVTYLHFRLKGRIDYGHGNMNMLHGRIMETVREADFWKALRIWDLDDEGWGFYDKQFFLQERGILKRLVGDLNGSLEDLTKALETEPDDYDCLKHLAYVNYLLGDLKESRKGARRCMALEPNKSTYDEGREGIEQADLESHYLGGCRVAFLGFNLG